MNSFREWLGAAENTGVMNDLAHWFGQLQQRSISSIKASEGYISISIGSLVPVSSVRPPVALPSNIVKSEPYLSSGASMEHFRAFGEVTEKGWKGKAALVAASGLGLNWNKKDTASFEKGMNGGTRSIPQMVGKEMGLLFEVEVFAFLVTTFKLRVIGDKDLNWALGEQARLGELISGKIGKNLGRLVIEFIRGHATGKTGMGNLIHSKAMSLVRQCVVDSIEFTGGENGSVAARIKSDTADLRIGCAQYLPGMRKDVGFSLKAMTETRVEVRHLSGSKALSILGAGRNVIRNYKEMTPTFSDEVSDEPEEVPLSEDRRSYLMDAMQKAAELNYTNKPRKFASLLELLVTGGADTIPAYRSLLQADSSPGWSNAIGKDFITKDDQGSKLGAKLGSVIEVKSTKTYIKLTYMVDGGNHYGTSVQFEPKADGSHVSVVVSNLINRGVK